jgi:hypothetical protein
MILSESVPKQLDLQICFLHYKSRSQLGWKIPNQFIEKVKTLKLKLS